MGKRKKYNSFSKGEKMKKSMMIMAMIGLQIIGVHAANDLPWNPSYYLVNASSTYKLNIVSSDEGDTISSKHFLQGRDLTLGDFEITIDSKPVKFLILIKSSGQAKNIKYEVFYGKYDKKGHKPAREKLTKAEGNFGVMVDHCNMPIPVIVIDVGYEKPKGRLSVTAGDNNTLKKYKPE
jgi:hypothetical protein